MMAAMAATPIPTDSEAVMPFVCFICRYEQEDDDLAIDGRRAICLRCMNRNNDTTKQMPRELREAVRRVAGEEGKT